MWNVNNAHVIGNNVFIQRKKNVRISRTLAQQWTDTESNMEKSEQKMRKKNSMQNSYPYK